MPDELKELLQGSDRLITYSAPMELRIADTDLLDGKPKTQWRMPMTGEIVVAGTQGAVEYRRWWATISTERKDTQNSIVERNASVAGFLQWMDAGGGNVRFMHEMDPVGRIFEEDFEIRDAGVYVGFSIPVTETKAIQKIETGLIRFVSIGFNIDWAAPEPIIWEPGGTARIRNIVMVELSIGDFGACPGTDIKEERNAQPETLIDRLKRHHANLASMITKLSPGAAPENHKSSQTEETEEMDEAKLKEILSGALTPLMSV
jgi:phage head maturation protease